MQSRRAGRALPALRRATRVHSAAMSSSTDPSGAPDPKPAGVRSRWRVLAYRAIGLAALGLAAAGVVLPLLPTTPFLLVAVWAFARGAPEFGERLYAHPKFGPFLRDWDERHAIPVSGKVASVIGMSLAFAMVLYRTDNLVIRAVSGAVLGAVAIYILTRPS